MGIRFSGTVVVTAFTVWMLGCAASQFGALVPAPGAPGARAEQGAAGETRDVSRARGEQAGAREEGGARGGEGLAASTPQTQRLSLRVVYPPSGALIAATDSNFIFGSLNRPNARLTINGATVKVHTNGAFLAWLPVPSNGGRAGGSAGEVVYDIRATVPGDTVRLAHRIRIPAPRVELSLTGPLVVDSSSLLPRQPLMLGSDELVRVSIRAPRNVAAFVTAGTTRRNLVNEGARPVSILGGGTADSLLTRDIVGDQSRWSTLIPARLLQRGGRVTVARGRDTVSLPVAPVALSDSAGPHFGVLVPAVAQVPDTDRVVIARPSPGGTYKWLLIPGTVVEVTGREGDFARIRFDESLEAWVPVADVQMMPAGFVPPRPVPLNSRLVSSAEWVDLVIPMGRPAPYHVETFNDRIELTLHGVRANLDNVTHPAADTLVRSVRTVQVQSDRAVITLRTSRPPFGYMVMFRDGNFVLRVRRAPRASQGSLRGLTIAVDAGHPPAGATGPTGLYEAEATLQIAQRLRTLLEGKGARVIMTRTNSDPLDLGMRPVIARRGNAHAFVSIHLNALPDGINPFEAHGTSTYYFNEMSEPLAREVQQQMLRRLRLRDLGVMYNTFAVTRPTWMPSILCEGAFIMIPEQEEAARTPAFQTAYATAVVDGLVRYFSSVAAGR